MYASGLVFSPAGSRTRIHYETQEPSWINTKPIMEDSWSACLRNLEGHSGSVNSVSFSSSSKLLTSASNDLTARVWDASSGQCLQGWFKGTQGTKFFLYLLFKIHNYIQFTFVWNQPGHSHRENVRREEKRKRYSTRQSPFKRPQGRGGGWPGW